MGNPQGKGIGTILKNHYERILYPFDVFRQGKTLADIVNIVLTVFIDVVIKMCDYFIEN